MNEPITLKKAGVYRITLDDGSSVLARFTGNLDYQDNPIFNQHELTRVVPLSCVQIITKDEVKAFYLGHKPTSFAAVVGADPSVQMPL